MRVTNACFCNSKYCIYLSVDHLSHRNYWPVRKWEDAAILAFWLALLYVTLEGPHQVRLLKLDGTEPNQTISIPDKTVKF